MTISATYTPAQASGNGVTVAFPFVFKTFDQADLVVIITDASDVDTTQTITTHYSVSLNADQNNNPGGTVTMLTAPATGETLTIAREISPLQETDITNGGGFYPEVLEDALDRLTMLSQQLSDELTRTLRLPVSLAGATLPTAEANKFIGWAPAGGVLVNLDGTGVGDALNVNYTPAGTGAVATTAQAKLREIVSVKDFGATGDGTTDDTAAIAAAIAAALKVYFPGSGTYICGTVSTLRNGQELFSNGATLKLKSATNSNLLEANAVSVKINGLKFDGNSANNASVGTGFRITNAANDIVVDGCEFTDFKTAGISSASTGGDILISNCWVHDNLADGIVSVTPKTTIIGCNVHNNADNGIEVGAGAHNSKVEGCTAYSNGAVGIIFSGSGGSLTDVQAVGNKAFSNTSHGIQFNTVTRGVMSGNLSCSNALSGLDSYASTYVTLTGNLAYANTVRGIEVDSASYYNTVVGNVVYRNGQEGVSVYRSPTTVIEGNQILENSTASAGTYHGLRLWDPAATLASANCRIIGNNCSDDRGGSATQGYGISLENSPTGTVIIGNKLTPNVTGAINGASGHVLLATGNNGYVTENSGTGSVASGATTAVITHGLSVTPTAEDVWVNFTEQGTADYGRVWLGPFTSTQFTVNVSADPGASNLDFSWGARVLV